MGKIPVRDLYNYCDMMLAEKWGYIYGTAGIKWTSARQDQMELTKGGNPNYEMSIRYGSKWIGHYVTDCSGAIVYIWAQHGLKIPHGSSSMVRQGYIVDCGADPHPGWAALVDPTPETPDNKHIGIVMADGLTVFEAKGTVAGCTTSLVTDKKWTKFGRFVDVDYDDQEDPDMDVLYYAEVVTKTGNLNLRAGPSTSDPKIGSIPKGAIVEVYNDYCDWDFIGYEGKTGYAAAQYLKKIDDPAPDPGPDPSPGTDVVIKMSVLDAEKYRDMLSSLTNVFDRALHND